MFFPNDDYGRLIKLHPLSSLQKPREIFHFTRALRGILFALLLLAEFRSWTKYNSTVLLCVKKNELLGSYVFISMWSLKEGQTDLNVGVVFNVQQRNYSAGCQPCLLSAFVFGVSGTSPELRAGFACLVFKCISKSV